MLFDTEIQRIQENALEPREKLLWSGRPDPARALIGTLAIWLFAVPWTAFAVFWMWGASGAGKRSLQPGWTVDFLFPFFGLPFVLIGLAMMSAPYWAYLKAKRTVYAITDKRVLIIEVGKSRTVQSYSGEDIGNIKRTERVCWHTTGAFRGEPSA